MVNRLQARQRLNSWKEIATFFERDERTVKRWEANRGLPVQRVPGAARCKVYADTRALKEWLRQDAKSILVGGVLRGASLAALAAAPERTPEATDLSGARSRVSAAAGQRRLSGWKEIANFFERDECTVKRWESKRGLPVHRMPGQSRSRVHADAHELSLWLSSAAPGWSHAGLEDAADGGVDGEHIGSGAGSEQTPGVETGEPALAMMTAAAWRLNGAAERSPVKEHREHIVSR